MNLLELMQKYSGITALCIYIPLLILILHIRQLYRNKMAMQEKEKQLKNLQNQNRLLTSCLQRVSAIVSEAISFGKE